MVAYRFSWRGRLHRPSLDHRITLKIFTLGRAGAFPPFPSLPPALTYMYVVTPLLDFSYHFFFIWLVTAKDWTRSQNPATYLPPDLQNGRFTVRHKP